MAFNYSTKPLLRKTTQEKELLKNIHALEESASSEKSPERKRETLYQLKELKGHLSRISGVSYSDLLLENAAMKKELNGLKQRLEGAGNAEFSQGDSAHESLSTLYKLLLSRYAGVINEGERKTVGEIKALVSKEDLTIQSLAQQFIPENYSFGNHFFQAAEKAFAYVRDEIMFVKADINIFFWLTPKEITQEKIGDDEDQAVFLCSLLYALGDEKAEVVIAEMENASSHAFVITELSGKFLLLDPSQKHDFREFYGEKKDALEKYSFAGAKIKRFLYKFNNSNYEQFEETGGL